MASPDGLHHVFLELSSRVSISDNENSVSTNPFETNRIALKCDSVQISTSKTVPPVPVPLWSIGTGESKSVAIEGGMASKQITLSGIITEQQITKQFRTGELPKEKVDTTVGASENDYKYTDEKGKWVSVHMTAQEVAQLLHSYVDSSIFQVQQHFNKLILFIPSRVGPKWIYHDVDEAGDTISPVVGKNTSVEDAPLIPFTFAVRGKGTSNSLDAVNSFPLSRFPKPLGSTTNRIIQKGITGFIQSVDTTLVGGQPFVEFNLNFAVAQTDIG